MSAVKPLYERFAQFIEEEGHHANLSELDDSDCRIRSVWFKSKGLRFHVTVSEDDPQFFSVGLSYSLPNTSPADLLRRIAHDVCADTKAVKIELQDSNLTATVEQYFAEPDGFKPIFWRCVSSLRHCTAQFFQKLREAAPPDPEREAREAAQQFLLSLSKKDT